jgi:SAM-dependent methyltransferase
MKNPLSSQVWTEAQTAELRYWEERKRWCESVKGMLDYLVYLANGFAVTGSVLAEIPAAACLEVGVGPFGIGSLVFHARTDATIVGIEPLPRIAIACSDAALNSYVDGLSRRVHYQQVQGEHMPFDTGHFDVVACHNVIDHCADPAQVIGEMRRVLKPGGVLLLNLFTFSRLGRLKFECNRRLNPTLDLFVEHPWSYTPDSIAQLVSSLGFASEPTPDLRTNWLGRSTLSKLVFRRLPA